MVRSNLECLEPEYKESKKVVQCNNATQVDTDTVYKLTHYTITVCKTTL